MLFSFYPTKAQEKTLKEVKYKRKKRTDTNDERIKTFAPGMKILHIDSVLMKQYALQNMASLLSQQVPVFIKSYGINNLATLNFRGSSSAQSQVYWNGVPLNNAALGVTDVSLLNVNSFDKINIVYGSSSALLGSGNVGGALLLENINTPFDSLHKCISKIATEAGSFGNYKLALQSNYSGRRWQVDTRIMGQSAQNNFSYTDLNGKEQKMSNAHLNGINALLNATYKIDNSSTLNIAGWYQYYDRQIPPALFEASSNKQQKDESLRFLVYWKKQKNANENYYIKAAFLQDRSHYSDTQISLTTRNISYQYYQEAGWKKIFNRHHQLLVFVPINISWTRPDGDSATRYQNKIALAAAYKYQAFQERFQVSLSSRLEKINTQTVLLPGLNTSFQLFPFLELRANIQRSYRAPTLNEWYYKPGGNIDLKPEDGWNEDAGYHLKLNIAKNIEFNHDLSAFNRLINNWILWFGGSIWTPHNIAQVQSRGIESINNLVWQNGLWQFHMGLNTSFVLATTRASAIPNDGSIGKQIPYSPRYNGQGNIGLGYKKIYLNYNHTYTGYRYTTTDESQYITPYQTGNIYLSYTHLYHQKELKLSLQCNNIWNEKYEVVNLRPMPQRNWAMGLGITF